MLDRRNFVAKGVVWVLLFSLIFTSVFSVNVNAEVVKTTAEQVETAGETIRETIGTNTELVETIEAGTETVNTKDASEETTESVEEYIEESTEATEYLEENTKSDLGESDGNSEKSSSMSLSSRSVNSELDFEFDEMTGTIIDYHGTDTEVVIPATIGDVSVTKIGDSAFEHNNLTNVVIPSSVTTIGDYAFYDNQLTAITIPDSVTKIGIFAFAHNNLTNVVIPSSVTTIGENAFKYNSITNKSIPDSITTLIKLDQPPELIQNPTSDQINFYCFDQDFEFDEMTGTITYYYGTDTEVVIPATICDVSVTAIAKSVFSWRNLTSVVIPETVTTIDDHAFSGNQFSEITIPDSVINIGRFAFAYNNLTNIVIPSSVTTIGDHAFSGNQFSEITIPDSVINIGISAFASNNLTNVVIPSSVTTIGRGAFKRNSITSKSIPDSITTLIKIWDYELDQPKELIQNPTIEQIDFYCFDQDFEFDEMTGTIIDYHGTDTEVVIPATIVDVPVTKIGRDAFGDNNLTNVVIPSSVTTIGDYAFFSNQLATITIPDSVTNIGRYTFTYNNLTNVVIPSSVTTIGDYAFSNNQLTAITIFDSVTNIGISAFAHNNLTNVVIPSSVTTIGENSFKHNSITSKNIPDSITLIMGWDYALLQPKELIQNPTSDQINFYCFDEEFAFDEMTGTITHYCGTGTEVVIPATICDVPVTKIGRDAFGDNNLTNVVIPSSVTTIGDYAFFGNQLTTITIFDSVTNIGISAFAHNNLTNVVIPSSVTTIGEGAFKCNPITYVSLPDSINMITDYYNKDSFPNPSIAQIRELCFEPYASLIGNQYVKAYSNIRRMSDGQIIETLKMPIYVTGTLKGDRFEFTYKGQNAYVDPNFTTSTGNSPSLTGYAKSTTNVRNSPNGSVTGTILRGHKVSGTLVGNWVRFTYSGKTCYVYSSMLQADPIKVTRYIYANSIIRSAPNGSMITKLWRPLLINGTLEGAWTKFTYNSKTAYVASSLTTTTNPPITGYAKSAINVRNAPGGSVIGTIPIGRQVKGVLVGNMVRFTYNNRTGYISASLLQATPVKVTRYIIANSIIRSAPNGSIIIRTWRPLLVSGTIEGAWLKFTYNSRTAYVAMSLTTTNNPAMTGYAKQKLYVRNTPNGSVVGTIPRGYKVSGVLVGNMVRFTYNGKTSYVYASLLQKDSV